MFKLDSLKEWIIDFKQTTLFKEWKYWLSLCVTVTSGLYLLCSLGLLGLSVQKFLGFPGKELVEALYSKNHNNSEGEALYNIPKLPAATWIFGLIQMAAPLLGAGVLQWTSLKGFKRMSANTLSSMALFAYIVAFGLTYNAAVLFLAVVAWMLAAAHLGEIIELNIVAGEAVAGLSSFSRARTETFYEEFYLAVRKVSKSGGGGVLSVEQRWTMDYTAWPEYVQGDKSEVEKMESLIEGIKKTAFCRAIVDSGARSFLFIGPMPQRVGQSYEPDSFSQLIALVYSMCVLEIARRIRLTEPNATENMSMRAQCAIADVPIWVKIAGDRYWVLQGDSRVHFVIQRGAARARADSGGRQDHTEDIQSYGRVIESYARNARRAYEYVSALLIQAAIELGKDENVVIRHILSSLIRKIYGREPVGIDSYLKHLEIREGRQASVNDITHLFALFLGLHLSREITLDPRLLENYYNHTTIARLWERSA